MYFSLFTTIIKILARMNSVKSQKGMSMGAKKGIKKSTTKTCKLK